MLGLGLRRRRGGRRPTRPLPTRPPPPTPPRTPSPCRTRAPCATPDATPGPYPAPDAWEPNQGPGGPARTFAGDELDAFCAFLSPHESTIGHHNHAVMYDGYLLMPWAAEWGEGGLTFWEFDDPCEPRRVGVGLSDDMRETHAIGFSSLGGRWAVVDMLDQELGLRIPNAGLQFWDVSDPSAPAPVSQVLLPGVVYPDSYTRINLSVFWQVPYAYVASSDNGLHIVDATDPLRPRVVGQYPFEPTLRAGQVQVVGNLLVVTTAEGARTALLDVSDPENPMPIPGGDFDATDGDGVPREAYFTTFANGHVYYARKEGGGGLFVWDVRDPSAPRYAGGYRSDGNGGYVFLHGELAFVGESSFGAIYDVSDLGAVTPLRRYELPRPPEETCPAFESGDMDTLVPVGNVAVLSADDPSRCGDEARPEESTGVYPYASEPDTRAPRVTFVHPADGATGLAPTSRVGVSFDEMIDVKSAFEGSVRLYVDGADPDETRVAGVVSAQEALVNFHPFCPLEAGVTYLLEIPAGGVSDTSGNAVEETFQARFTIAGG